jgi:hypothetical protein
VDLFWHPAVGEPNPPASQSHSGAAMKIVSFVECRQRDVIERILRHCRLWQGPFRTLPSAREAPARPSQVLEPRCALELFVDPELVAAEAGQSDTHRSRELQTMHLAQIWCLSPFPFGRSSFPRRADCVSGCLPCWFLSWRSTESFSDLSSGAPRGKRASRLRREPPWQIGHFVRR